MEVSLRLRDVSLEYGIINGGEEMTWAKLKCTECGTILEITSKIIDGKELKCPRCGSRIFTVEENIKIVDDPLMKIS